MDHFVNLALISPDKFFVVPTFADLPSNPVEAEVRYVDADKKLYIWNNSIWEEVGAGAGGTVTAVTATGPLVSSGGATPDISMHVADSTHSGYLSSADWNTFNAGGGAGSPELAVVWAPGDGAIKHITHGFHSTNVMVQVLDETNTKIEIQQVQCFDSQTVIVTSSVVPTGIWTVLLKDIDPGYSAGEVVSTWQHEDGATKFITHGFNSKNIMTQVYNDFGVLVDIDTVQCNSLNTIMVQASSAPPTFWTVLLKKIS